MEWLTVFDEVHPEVPTTEAELHRLTDAIRQPLKAEEVRAIIAAQSNPFPPRDPLHGTWRPIDPSAWALPSGPLPPPYLSLLRWSNGGAFRTGERWFQFFPALDDAHGLRAMLLA